jgi:hypothetical protein
MTATPPRTAGLPFVETRMNFSGPVQGRARVDVPNWSNTNMALEPHDLRIHDARPVAGSLSLDREGFTLVRHECGVTETSDMTAEGAEGARYLAGEAGFLADMTGASLVLPQGTGLLKRANKAGAIGPSRWVHMDYTAAAARTWAGWIEAWEGRPLKHYPRFAIFQTWRCLTPPPCDNTLTLCDASSIDDADCIVFDACMREPYDEPGNAFESQFARFNPAQRWYYFPVLTPGEMIVFKGFDSDPARDAQPLHNSIDLPGWDATPRVSVEARFFAFFT